MSEKSTPPGVRKVRVCPFEFSSRSHSRIAGTLVDHDESAPVGKTSVGSGPWGTARAVMSLEGAPPFLAVRASAGVLPVSQGTGVPLAPGHPPRYVLHLPVPAIRQVSGWTRRLGSTPPALDIGIYVLLKRVTQGVTRPGALEPGEELPRVAMGTEVPSGVPNTDGKPR